MNRQSPHTSKAHQMNVINQDYTIEELLKNLTDGLLELKVGEVSVFSKNLVRCLPMDVNPNRVMLGDSYLYQYYEMKFRTSLKLKEHKQVSLKQYLHLGLGYHFSIYSYLMIGYWDDHQSLYKIDEPQLSPIFMKNFSWATYWPYALK
jgi:hypothetical protein